jgi:hypothetical protein
MPIHRIDNGLIARLDNLAGPGVGIFFARQLEQILAEVYEEKTPPRAGLNLFIPDMTSVSSGAKTFTRRMWTSMGIAKWVENYSKDFPRVATASEEATFKTKRMGASYGWTLDEIKAAQFANVPLESRLGVAARRTIEQKHNDTIWLGDETVGLHGILSYPWTPHVVLAEPLSSSATSNSALVVAVMDFIDGIKTLTKGVTECRRLMIPLTEWNYISSTQYSTASDKTILDYMRSVRPGVEFISVAELDDDFTGLGYQVLVADGGRDSKVWMPVYPGGEVFVQEAVVQDKLYFEIIVHGKSGGVFSDFPLEGAIGELP